MIPQAHILKAYGLFSENEEISEATAKKKTTHLSLTTYLEATAERAAEEKAAAERQERAERAKAELARVERAAAEKAVAEKAVAEKAMAALGLLRPLEALSLDADTLRTATAAVVAYCDAQGAGCIADLVERASKLSKVTYIALSQGL